MFRGDGIYSIKERFPQVGDRIAFSKPIYKEFPGMGWHLIGFDLVKGKVIDQNVNRQMIFIDRSARYTLNRFIWVKLETLKRSGCWRKPWKDESERQPPLAPAGATTIPTPSFGMYPPPKRERPVLVLTAG